LDAHTRGALQYAESLTPEVIAVHVRTAGSDIERLWRAGGQAVPLIVVEASDGSRASALRQTLAVLQRTEQPGQIALVIPWQPDQAADGLGLDDLAESSAAGAALVIHRAPAAS
jgi:hypothetical protein